MIVTLVSKDSPFYYRMNLHRDGVSAVVVATVVQKLPLVQEVTNQIVIQPSTEGVTSAGLYVWDGERWRYVLPYPEVTQSIVNGNTIDVFYGMTQDYTGLPSTATLWKNGVQTTGTTVTAGPLSVWAATSPPSYSTGDVRSVNGITPDGDGNVNIGIADIPNLQTDLDAKLTQVTSVNTDGLSLVDDNGTTDSIAKLLGVAAYDGLTLTPDPVGKTIQVRGVPATTTAIGMVKIGTGLSVASDGTVSYNLPIATSSTLGGVKQGTNITISGDGTISATAAPYTLPPATTSILGGVKIGSGINVAADGTISNGLVQGVTSVVSVGTGVSWVADDGTTNSQAKIKSVAAGSNINVTTPDSNTLSIAAIVPVQSVSNQTGDVIVQAVDNNSATGTSLIADSGGTTGEIKLKTVVAGTAITITPDSNGNLVFASSGGYTLPPATATVLGGVKIGANVSVTADGTISVAAPYTLPAATTSTLGGVIVGSNLNVSAGTISVPVATTSIAGVVKAGSGLAVAGDGTLSVTAAGGVTSVNAKTGAVSITGVGSVTVDNSGTDIVISSSSGISDAPNDGNLYGRKDLDWAQIPDVTQALIAVNSAGSAGSTSLVFNPSVNNAAELKGVIAGTGISINDDGAGNLTFTASANGFVTSVNSKVPDGTGAVTLTASDVSALPTAGGVMTGDINMNSASTVINIPTPVNSGDAVPLSYLTGMTIDNGVYA